MHGTTKSVAGLMGSFLLLLQTDFCAPLQVMSLAFALCKHRGHVLTETCVKKVSLFARPPLLQVYLYNCTLGEISHRIEVDPGSLEPVRAARFLGQQVCLHHDEPIVISCRRRHPPTPLNIL